MHVTPHTPVSTLMRQPIETPYQKLLKLIKNNDPEGKEILEEALSSPDMSVFKKLVPKVQQVEEIAELMPGDQGRIYLKYALVLEKDGFHAEAFPYNLKAAQKNIARAQTALGSCYLEGIGTAVDTEKAKHWLEEAANQDHPRAQRCLGNMYNRGIGVSKDINSAYFWFNKAAKQGDKEAIARLEDLKNQNKGEIQFIEGHQYEMQRNHVKAFQAYLQASTVDHVPSLYKIARAYLFGRGTKQNKIAAYQIYLDRAEHNEIQALYNLGFMLEKGEGTTLDLAKAKRRYEQAAALGCKQSKDRLEALESSDVIETFLEESEKEQFWQLDTERPTLQKNERYKLIPVDDAEGRKMVLEAYNRSPIPDHVIDRIERIYNPALESAFASRRTILQLRSGNSAFKPKLNKEKHASFRAKMLEVFEATSQTHPDPNNSDVKLNLFWHGTNLEKMKSICTTGFANLSSTDIGYFGKGIYFAREAKYAYENYSQEGALILAAVARISSFLVVKGDESMIQGKPGHANYGSHIVPVRHIHGTVFHAITPKEEPVAFEVVVFEDSDAQPLFSVTLKPVLLKQISMQPESQPSLAESLTKSDSKKIAKSEDQLKPLKQIVRSLTNQSTEKANSKKTVIDLKTKEQFDTQ